jgi:hypothetical protein
MQKSCLHPVILQIIGMKPRRQSAGLLSVQMNGIMASQKEAW